jgi:PHD finger-like domain-containing protein 5A
LDVSAKSVSVFRFKILLLEGRRPPSDGPPRDTTAIHALVIFFVCFKVHVTHNFHLIYTVGDGKCVICDSFVNPAVLVRVCDECNYGSFEGRCCVCGGVGVTDAYYCRECVQQEKDRDGCPKIVNLGATKTDLFYERKKYGFKRR